MAVPNYSKIYFLIYIQFFCIQFCISIDDIVENFEEVAIADEVHSMATTSSVFTTKEITTKKLEIIKFSENDLHTSKPTTKSRSTLQSILKKQLPIEVSKDQNNTNRTNDLCPYFIYSAGFRMEKMPDVWQPVYYKMADKLKCFKIQIRKTTNEERKQYEQEYGNFNGSMDWNECHFEIKSSSVKDRKHFLQGGVSDIGVMRNIVIVQDDDDNFVLREESLDQWLMVKGLLLIRDCDSGGTVVFTRVPHRPRSALIREALEELGEEMTGEFLCEDPE